MKVFFFMAILFLCPAISMEARQPLVGLNGRSVSDGTGEPVARADRTMEPDQATRTAFLKQGHLLTLVDHFQLPSGRLCEGGAQV